MSTVSDDLRRRLDQHDQSHVLAGWDRLDDAQRRELLAQVESVDIASLRAIWEKRNDPAPAPGRRGPAGISRGG